ncbi:MAG TPA: hypothetical protein VGR35_06420 [Tepidisphaeraceae bacterium]|nr:hypothetical protein [Tepidisphaeraceae bacterium]
MQKVLDLLEKHVQWVALGLGAVWLLLMTWSYVITPPAEVEIGNRTLTAGNVDEYTVENAVRPLEEAMKPKEAPPMVVDNFAERWLARMSWENVEPIRTAGLISSHGAIPDKLLERSPTPGMRIAEGGGQPQGAQGAQPVEKVATLPTPAPTPVASDWRFGRSTILKPPPIVPVGQPQPPTPPVPEEVDKDWITQSFKVSLPAIAELFKKHQVPPAPIGMTAFLKVEMVRQELLPDGQWGQETTLQPLPPFDPNAIRPPWPANGNIHQENAYLNWAVQNTGDIIQPAFYQTVEGKGDIWERPGEPAPLPGGGAFNPAQFAEGPIPPNITPEQRKQIMDYRRQQALLRRQQQQQNRQPRTPRGGRGAPEDPGMMMEGDFAPIDSDRPKFLQVRPYPPRRGYPPDMYDPAMMEDPAMMMEDEFMMEGMQPQQQQIMGVGVPDVDYPAGLFDPATWHLPAPTAPGAPPPVNPRPSEVSIWAHDDTVQPGKTYRYKARYMIKNPLYQQPAVAKDAADAKVFAIESEFSQWGPAIEVPPLTNFFIANVHQGRIRFDVYRWDKGQQHHTTVTVGPGDVIAADAGGVDFRTGHTVVDVRTDLKSRDPVVFLANAGGRAVVRTARGDREHPVNKKLKEVVDAAKAAAAQQAAAAGGLPVR